MGCCGDCCVLYKESREPIRYDPTFNGPTHNRSCTDIIWLIVFILFLGAWGYVGYRSIKDGDIEQLLAPMDSKGKRCGVDAGLLDKKYLVFFDITKCLSPGTPITGCSTTQVCVNKCPDKTVSFDNMDQAFFNMYKSDMVCKYDINSTTMSFTDAQKHIDGKRCANYIIKSLPVLGRCIGDLSTFSCSEKNSGICVKNPQESQKAIMNSATALDSFVGWIVVMGRCLANITGAFEVIEELGNTGLELDQVQAKIADSVKFQQVSTQIVHDLVVSKWYLLGALVVVVVVCFAYILLLRWVVAPVVWASIAGFFGVLIFSLYLSYKNYEYYKANPVHLTQTTNLKGYFQSIFEKHQTWLGILIVAAVVFCILLLIVIFLRARIVIAIALIKEGSKAVFAVKSTVFFPIFPWVLQCAVLVYGVFVMMLLLSIGESAFQIVNLQADTSCHCENDLYTKDYEPCDPWEFDKACTSAGEACKNATCHFTGLDSPTSVVWLRLAHLFGLCWVMFFISGVSDMMLASTFSTWYWTFKKRNLPFFTLTSGIYRTIRYHLGTVALGSLIIAIVRVIRIILEYIDQKLKKFDNPVTKCLMCFCKCFCWCLENFLKFINKNAYIMCAVHGKNFCSSARDAFSLLMRNIVRVVVLDKVTDFIFFLSKILLSLGVGFAVYYILEWKVVYDITKGERLNYNYIPAIILGIATYFISTIFFNVYAMAVDTLFLCFLEDCERNDGSPEKPYFMSKNLMKILGKKNKME